MFLQSIVDSISCISCIDRKKDQKDKIKDNNLNYVNYYVEWQENVRKYMKKYISIELIQLILEYNFYFQGINEKVIVLYNNSKIQCISFIPHMDPKIVCGTVSHVGLRMWPSERNI